MVKTALALVVFLSLQTTSSVGNPFQPWGADSYQTVNAIEVARDGQTKGLTAQPATDWLTPFVGAWDTVDTYHPVSGAPIVERATRTCEMVMQGSYLQCETVATRPSGGGRTYRFLINHNRTMKRFEMLSLWSNVPHKAIQVMTPNAARDRWSIRELAVVGDDEPMSPHYSEIVFESDDRIVWTGRRVTIGVDPASAPISFVESWTKRP